MTSFISAGYWTAIAMNCMHRWNLRARFNRSLPDSISLSFYFHFCQIPFLWGISTPVVLVPRPFEDWVGNLKICALWDVDLHIGNHNVCAQELPSESFMLQFLVAHQTMQAALGQNISFFLLFWRIVIFSSFSFEFIFGHISRGRTRSGVDVYARWRKLRIKVGARWAPVTQTIHNVGKRKRYFKIWRDRNIFSTK